MHGKAGIIQYLSETLSMERTGCQLMPLFFPDSKTEGGGNGGTGTS